MQLIIKPTSSCNFNCTFCSAGKLNIPTTSKVPDKIKDIMKVIKPDDVVVTGGDPLLMPMSYYDDLLSLGDFTISLTTNLKAFYYNPEKWVPLFKNPRVGVCTSFQYGSGRMWDKNTVYDEEMFLKVMAKFKEYMGFHPTFISVITKENCDRAIDNVLLAKKLDTECRLNGVFKAGRSGEYFPRHEMIKIYNKIIDMGLEQYEVNCKIRGEGHCPYNTAGMCETTIRSAWVDNTGDLKYGTCEDFAIYGTTLPLDKERPNDVRSYPPPEEVISEKCFGCELFYMCNGCKTNRLQAKDCEGYCEGMLSIKDDMIKHGWKLC